MWGGIGKELGLHGDGDGEGMGHKIVDVEPRMLCTGLTTIDSKRCCKACRRAGGGGGGGDEATVGASNVKP